MSKTIQIRVSEQEHAFIKNAFRGQNISQLVRDYLLAEAEEKLKDSDVSLQGNDPSIQSFIEILSAPEVQKMLYKIFQSSKGGD